MWAEAGPKIAAGKLAAVFIESSYDDSQSVDRLFGHLTPKFIMEELSVLAREVEDARSRVARAASEAREAKKRKRGSDDTASGRRKPNSTRHSGSAATDDAVSPKTVKPARVPSSDDVLPTRISESPHISTPTTELSLKDVELRHLPPDVPAPVRGPPLKGLKVVIIHVKEKLRDGPARARSSCRSSSATRRTPILGASSSSHIRARASFSNSTSTPVLPLIISSAFPELSSLPVVFISCLLGVALF